MLRLITFGGIGLESDDGSAVPRLRPPRLAMLAVLAAAGERGVSRERIAGLLWPESDEQRASHSLRQARYALRSDLDLEVVRAEGSVLSLDPSAISSDVAEFHAALAAGDRRRAISLARGPFLDGFYLPNASEFERWVEEERARLAGATTTALLSLANEASQCGERDATVEWWRALTLRDPLSGRFALGFVKALAARGDRADALTFVRQHTAVVHRELETEPDPEIKRLESELRSMPAPILERRTPALVDGAPKQIEPAVAAEPERPLPGQESVVVAVTGRSRARRSAIAVGAAAVLVLTATAAFVRQRGWFNRDTRPVMAVGLIREDGLPDSQRVGGVLTDMLATNLARVEGLAVLANSRVLEMMQPTRGRDSSAAYADAARRAGASELLEGRVTTLPRGALELEMRRVELNSGIVREVYRARATDRYALVDSVTQVVAHRFRLVSPTSSVAAATTSSPMAYRLYEEGLRAHFSLDPYAAQRLMRAALEEDSTFAMAAYYEAVIGATIGIDTLPDGRYVTDAEEAALRLARRAPEGQRLMISAALLLHRGEPEGLTVAESLGARYPDDPRAQATLGRARWTIGDWAGSAQAIERAIALDSASDSKSSPVCHLCDDYEALAETYVWWDSLSAAARTEERFFKSRPDDGRRWYRLAFISARMGDGDAAHSAFRRSVAAGGGDRARSKPRIDLTLGDYEAVEQDARLLLSSSAPPEWADGLNLLLLALRNEGRLRDAIELHQTGWLAGFPAVPASPNDFDAGILNLERGDARAAAAVFHAKARRLPTHSAPGYRARIRTWNATLEAMALAAAGDTSGVRALIDTVEQWGSRSAYGRDRKAHHYLRGLMFTAQRRDEEAVREFQAAIHSPNLGFTRVNYELARALLRVGRPAEAVGTLQSSLRGEIDASNLYVTRTDLHELLAQAFDGAGQRDSAAAHYRAVVSAWRRADARYESRRDRAAAWLAGYARGRTAH